MIGRRVACSRRTPEKHEKKFICTKEGEKINRTLLRNESHRT